MFDIGAEEMWTPFLEEVNDLMVEEKAARHENDHIKIAQICTRILRLAWDHKELARLREFLVALTKRRGQAKKAVVDMVQLCMEEFLPLLPTREEKYKMLATLREASEGKLFLEKEYADCTKRLCEMLEEDGKVEEATKTIQEIQIETYGSLTTREKVDFILYQMKLVLERRDFVRCQILSRKISRKHLGEAGLEAQKIQYFEFMVRYYVHEKMVLDTAKAFQTIYDTHSKAELDLDGQQKRRAFQNFIVYLMVAPYTNEKVDLLNIANSLYARELDENELLARFVRKFLSNELLPFNSQEIEGQFAQFEPFRADLTEHAAKHAEDFLRQLIQHNIRVVQKYYQRVRLGRLAQLVGVSQDLAEKEIGDMVVNKRIAAKINRMQGIVVFKKNKHSNDILNDWNYDIRHMLDKIENTCHLINREKVVHNVL